MSIAKALGRLARAAVLVVPIALLGLAASVARAQTPFDGQYGSSVVSPEIAEKGKQVAAVFTGVLPETGGVSLLTVGILLVCAGAGLFVLRRPPRR